MGTGGKEKVAGMKNQFSGGARDDVPFVVVTGMGGADGIMICTDSESVVD